MRLTIGAFGVAAGLLCGWHASPETSRVREAPGLDSAWLRVDFAKERLTRSALDTVSEPNLALIRGVIFGRHGRIFRDSTIQAYLATQTWYRPDSSFSNDRLSAVERDNLDLVREIERDRHRRVALGDMRFWKDSVVPPEQYPEEAGDKLRLLIAEVEAIHGRRFDDDPWMQEYFNVRYWYHADSKYSPRMLSVAERRNAVIFDSLLRSSGTFIRPGEMARHQSTPITDSMLQGAGLYDLRLLRNEVYARRGRYFETLWLRRYFYDRSWYVAREGFSDKDLTPVDKANIATIVDAETRIHQSLAAARLDSAAIGRLSFEESRKLRNEIYARHGRTFIDPSLQGYFSSLPWYHPNPKFKESDLNEVERANAEFLLAYQEHARKEIRKYEG